MLCNIANIVCFRHEDLCIYKIFPQLPSIFISEKATKRKTKTHTLINEYISYTYIHIMGDRPNQRNEI